MKLTPICLAAALALTAGASLAQPSPTGRAPAGGEGHHWQRPDPAQMAERHAQHLRDALQLRPDQEPALRALVAASQPPMGEREHGPMRGGEAGAGMSTPQRLDRMEARMAEHAARFRTHAEAVKRFYAQLSPSQQRAFDAMPMMGPHEHGGHGMKGEGPGRHGGFGGPAGHEHGPPPAGD